MPATVRLASLSMPPCHAAKPLSIQPAAVPCRYPTPPYRHNRDLRTLWNDFDSLFLADGLLYRRPVNSPPSAAPQLVLPRGSACHVLPSLHNDSTAGHFGPSRTLRRAQDRFYWPGMTLDVAHYCRECIPCQQRRPPVPQPRAPFLHIVADRPFEIVATDITYMPLSSTGNKYVLVATDVFSKYVNLYAIPKQDAATVAVKLFRDFIGQHGVPDQLHSDQGPQYESLLITELCSRLNIRKSRISPYDPQGDGQVERFNRTMKNILTNLPTANTIGTCYSRTSPWHTIPASTRQLSSRPTSSSTKHACPWMSPVSCPPPQPN
ncbi:hypothetical protein Bbelb_187050 [Branchiostoma belcheri]|nr:hypothetical protein Bbelb_187050 [Branchiostoma belcheri]